MNLASLYSGKNDEKKAIEFWKEAREEAEATEDESLIGYVEDFLKNS